MKAAQISQYGGPEVLQTVSDAPKPSISDDQVLVEVFAAGVNPFDWKVRAGLARGMMEVSFPAVLGGDVAGRVAEVGGDVKNFAVGDVVYGLAGALSSHGSFAEFAPVSAAQVAPAPTNTSFDTAAALPLAGVSAYQAIVEQLDIQSGQKVLVHGGAGGIGSLAIQLAKHLGAHVATTVSATSLDFAKSLGADEVIDYNAQKFQEVLGNDFDAVFDTVGGDVYTDSFAVLKSGGKLTSMSARPNEELAAARGVTASFIMTGATTKRLASLAKLVEDGVLSIHVDKVFTLDQAADALSYLQNGHPQGKVVIHVRD